jgi:high-affinity nickel permease
MPATDGWLEGFLQGPTTLWVVLVVSLLVGLRHASDPDHLAAVTTLIASQERERIRKATSLGLLWGLGHGTTLVLVGLLLVLLGQYLPERVAQAAEIAVELIIVMFAVRLLVRWLWASSTPTPTAIQAVRPTATSTRTRPTPSTSTPTT